MNASQQLAHQLHERDPRLALLAMRPDKRPAVIWGCFQKQGPAMQTIDTWLMKPGYTVGVIAGKASHSLLVLDHDDQDTFDAWRFRTKDFNTLIDRGARGGRIWFRTPVPVESSKIGNTDLIAQGHVIMAPGAMHPSGKRYEILNDAPIFELPSLDAIPGLKLQPATVKGRLPAHARKILTQPTPIGFRSEAEASAVASMIRAGFEFYDVLEAFNRYGHPGLHFRTGGPQAKRWNERSAEQYLRITFERVSKWLEAHKSPHRELAEGMKLWALRTPWTGRAGANDRKAFIAHCDIAAECAKPEWHASIRRLAERSQMSNMAAARANHRLIKRGLLTLAKHSTAELAHIWTFAEGAKCCISSPKGKYDEVQHFAQTSSAGHDAFAWQGLGATCAQIWDHLKEGGDYTIAELETLTGRDRRTLERNIERMNQKHMVQIAPELKGRAIAWQRAENVNLNQIAHVMETTGITAARIAEHLRERDRHAEALKRTREAQNAKV